MIGEAVAQQAHCSAALIFSVEAGSRTLHPWLANRLDQIYGTGNAISMLCCAARKGKSHNGQERLGLLADDVIVIRLPQGGVTVPLSRRELLAAFGIGTVSGTVLDTLDHGLGALRPTPETLAEIQRTYDGFLTASRFSTSSELKDAIVGEIAVIDALRHRAPSREMRRDLTVLMARHAEAVSWLYEESFDVQSSLYWIDRTAFWAQTVDWHDMVAFTFHRRSSLAMTHANDGRQAVELAQHALRVPNTLPSVKVAILSGMGQSYALLGNRDASARAVDQSLGYLSQATDHPRNPALYRQPVVTDNYAAMLQTASFVLLGVGGAPAATIEPRLASIANVYNQRVFNRSRARLAHAYANAGAPEKACEIVADSLEALKCVPSFGAWRDLQRTTTVLNNRWPARSDVKEARTQVESNRN